MVHGDGRRWGVVKIDRGTPLHARHVIRRVPGNEGRVRPHRGGAGVLRGAVAPLLWRHTTRPPVLQHRLLLHLLRLRTREVLAPVQDVARDAPRDRRTHQNDDDDEGDGDDDVGAGGEGGGALTVGGGGRAAGRCKGRTYASGLCIILCEKYRAIRL